MDSEQDRELEMIRDQMHQTRANLADKLGTLESQVRDTVETATSAVATATETVSNTVEEVKEVVSNVTETVTGTVSNVTETVQDVVSNVQETVQETVSSVASALDVPAYVRKAPFASVGCSFAVGLIGGYLLGGSRDSSSSNGSMFGMGNGSSWGTDSGSASHATHATNAAPGAPSPPHTSTPASSSQSDSSSSMTGVFGDALMQAANSAKSLGVSALLGFVSQLAQKHLPEQAQGEAGRILNDVCLKLGGKPLPRQSDNTSHNT
jgi:ElaB/YqjD/DUF883 family membrane-anchored ribosome-binding protein